MTIQTFSPLQDSGNYYLNAEEFESKLMFTDTNASLNYAIIRYDCDDYIWKIIATGKLNGYNNNTDYSYRIDLDNYIKIEQYRTLDLIKYDTTIEEVLYQGLPKYMSRISLLLSTGNILTDNSHRITLQSNGEYWLNAYTIPSYLTATYKYDYKFYDKIDYKLNPITISDFVYGGTWLPITVYSDLSWTYILIKDKYGNTLVEQHLHSISTDAPTLFMIYIPIEATTVEMYSLEMQNNNLPTKIYNVVNKCSVNPYYFWNVNGSLDVIYSEGNVHEVNTITKDYITIGNQKFPMNIKNTKQYKSNTGFKLNQNQMYSLLKTPFVFNPYKKITTIKKYDNTDVWIYPDNIIDTISPLKDYKFNRIKWIIYELDSSGSLILRNNSSFGTYGFYNSDNIMIVKSSSNEQYMSVSNRTLLWMQTLLSSQYLQTTFINTIKNELSINGFTGVEISFENYGIWTITDWNNFKLFMTRLGTELHNINKKLMIEGPAIWNTTSQSWFEWKYQELSLISQIDYVIPKIYDYQFDYGNGEPNAPYLFISDSVRYITGEIDKSRIIWGLPSAGYQGITGDYTSTNLTYDDASEVNGYNDRIRDINSGELTWTNGGNSYFILDDETINLKKLEITKIVGDNNISLWHFGKNKYGSDYVYLELFSLKRLLLDTNTFEGYVGSKYSERNVELILTDEKTYKRKTNFNLTFWD